MPGLDQDRVPRQGQDPAVAGGVPGEPGDDTAELGGSRRAHLGGDVVEVAALQYRDPVGDRIEQRFPGRKVVRCRAGRHARLGIDRPVRKRPRPALAEHPDRRVQQRLPAV